MRARDFNPAEPEEMDRPQPPSPELATDLENLHRINAHFGGHRLVRRFLVRWLRPGGRYRLLDLCTGGADIPRLAVEWARAHGVALEITAVDFQPGTVEIARRRCADYPEITVKQEDAKTFGDPAAPYDFVFCSLALHHFNEDDAVTILARCRELSSRAVLVADLERGWLASAGAWLMTALLYREPMTKTDARLSVRRAFSFAELAALARRAGWENFGHARFRIARQAVWLDEKMTNDE